MHLLAVFGEQRAVRRRRINLMFQVFLGLGPTVVVFGTEQAQMKRFQQIASISGDSYFRCRTVETIPHWLVGFLSRVVAKWKVHQKRVWDLEA